jgi:hypothetical protein
MEGNLSLQQSIVFYCISLWILIWKGIALWRSAQLEQRNWFIVLLILGNLTFSILDIVYLFRFAKKRLTISQIKAWFKQTFSGGSKPS